MFRSQKSRLLSLTVPGDRVYKHPRQAHSESRNPEHYAYALPGKESSTCHTVPCGSSTARYDWLGA